VHEVSLVEALFDQADRAIAPRAAAAVRLVTVRIGELAGVDTELFRAAFEGCRGDRGYGAAALEIVDELAAWRCGTCGRPVAAGGPLRCAACDGIALLAAGGDLVLQRLELEVPEEKVTHV
jgi:Zn finger protein HypA/HybF involved in hydrogenase expression